ncbi:MAG: 4Fe-4S binding protein [Candidatus Cloacimonetes bacterium]|jgi:formate dehydrogenase (coenzyme F420) beta subunit|nr:4Fe-4S binding protein [Candidatus Cloacimonadota bacterium]MBT7469235.1 4Fe-4S binding protein [Candidatus Cloacimonadota bacterium]
MSKLLKIENNFQDTIKDFLKNLLENKKIDGVFSFRKNTSNYGLITDVKELENIAPLYPLMPANAGQLLGRFTPMKEVIAVVIHPCEFRAFIELAKREQGSLDNFLLITHTCGGVYPLKVNVKNEINEKQYWASVEKGEIPQNIRPTCEACEHIAPQNADILISTIGEKNDVTKLYLNTKKGIKFAKYYNDNLVKKSFEKENLKPLLEKKNIAKEKLFSAITDTGLDGLIDIFGKCVGCHGCNAVCPICYCTLCDFDSFNYDYNTPILEKELEQKGALRLPPDTLFFQLGRLSHMSFSCVGCGQCSDVCPANIPVASVFKKVGEKTAEMFSFIPGKDVKEPIPVMIFKEEEFPELGE